MAKEYINEFTELYKYEELAERSRELAKVKTALDFDCHASWCKEDDNIETLRYDAYVAIKKYNKAITDMKGEMKDVFYDKLNYADEHMRKPKKKFWDIFK